MGNKKILLLLFLIPVAVFSQVFSGPESVEYDASGNRWFVGQKNSGQIHIYSPLSGTLLPFASGLPAGPHGLEILGNVIYACSGSSVRGYNINTGNLVFNLNLGATFLNGITSDGNNFLFVTDFTAKRIYRVNTSTQTANIMVSGMAKTPNGIIYDGPGNRCVFVTWGTAAPIQAMALSDSTITTLTNTTLNNLDGITRDASGNWYVTAWSNNSLMRFDPGFSQAPVNVMSGLSSPADIDISANGDSIGIPNSGNANNVVFYTLPTVSVHQYLSDPDFQIFPNPGDGIINFSTYFGSHPNKLEIFDATGRKIFETFRIVASEPLDLSFLEPGFYYLNFTFTGGGTNSKKLVINKSSH